MEPAWALLLDGWPRYIVGAGQMYALPAAVVLTGKQVVACVHRFANVCDGVLLRRCFNVCIGLLPCRRILAGERREVGGEQLPAAARAAQAAGDKQVGVG